MAANVLVMPSVEVLELSDSFMSDDLDRFRLRVADLGLDFADNFLRVSSSGSSHPTETEASSDFFPLSDFIFYYFR